MRKNKKTTIYTIVFILVAAAVGYFIYIKTTPTVEEIAKQNHAKNDAPPEVVSPPNAARSESDGSPAKPPTPVLRKSSGNNGPVPTGAIVEFVCQTDSAANCTISLTNPSTKKILDLGQKPTISSSQPYFAAFWNWSAEPGSWLVAAQTKNGNQTATSAAQTLEVK